MDTRAHARALGTARQERGMALATAGRKRRRTLSVQIGLIDALLASPDRTATTDDIDPAALLSDRPDGAYHYGGAVAGLARAGLIRVVEIVRSDRASRNRGTVRRWTAAVPDCELIDYRRALAAELAALPGDAPADDVLTYQI